ncbi:DUF1700 domain-containing protein [Enterococcus sp.]|jgi:uncharacterized membrane protein|uniref:DUF1700 domain-containing protein n=1 Tax=Enterococcus sp. TaxID=35783 RepID=UPI0025B8A847|nr:DUF1700 domain-containing protein [Enterococcus sp.]
MDRITFIKSLAAELAYKTKPSEIHHLIDYYDEMIQDLMEDGLSEVEAVAKLGTPKNIAQSTLGAEEIVVQVPRRFHPLLLLIIFLGFPLWGSLLLAALLLMLSGLIVMWCLPFSTGIVGITGLIGGIASVILSPMLLSQGLHFSITQLGLGVIMFGIGIICITFTYMLSKPIMGWTQQFIYFPKALYKSLRKQVTR